MRRETDAKTWASTFDAATRPVQHALSALVARLRIALETDPDVTVVSLDGRSAYDTVSGAAFLAKLRQVAPALLPFVRGLEQAAADLQAGEELLAYQDDLYVITRSARAKPALDVVTNRVQEHCGIASNVGKTRVYNTGGGPAPHGVAALGDDVWRGDRAPPDRGFTALGVPLGHPAYVRDWGQRRIREEQFLLDHLPHLPDLQCA
eukprot:s2985_g6.t1